MRGSVRKSETALFLLASSFSEGRVDRRRRMARVLTKTNVKLGKCSSIQRRERRVVV